MAAKLPLDIHDAFYRVVHDYPAGVAALAVKMGVTPKVLYNKADPGSDGNNKPSLADGIVATSITGDKRIVQAFAHAAGGVYHDLPDLSHLSTDALMMHVLKIEQEGGDFYRVMQRSLEEDNQISKSEFKNIKREGYEWIAAILEGLARMEEMSGGADE